MKVSAIQLESRIGDISANLAACERLAAAAGDAGAEWIVLPEFFPTGMGFTPKLMNGPLSPDGPATELLVGIARRYRAKVGGSFLCRDRDGHVRNAYFLVGPDGTVGRHDKDIPTLWENCWYVGGDDDGTFDVDGLRLGVATCAEFGRTDTVKRLRGSDLVVGGSFTWHAPDYLPRFLGRAHLDRKLFSEVSAWAAPFARLVGAPVVEATHCGTLECRDQLLPLTYRCRIGDGAKICAADGRVLAMRDPTEGPGFILADVEVGAVEPVDALPDGSWIRPLGTLGHVFWKLQELHGRSWYRRHVARPSLRA